MNFTSFLFILINLLRSGDIETNPGPTNEKDCSEIETSYENVEAAVRKTEHNETVFIMGDFNAKVGKMKSPGTGFHGLRNRNESGDRSIER